MFECTMYFVSLYGINKFNMHPRAVVFGYISFLAGCRKMQYISCNN